MTEQAAAQAAERLMRDLGLEEYVGSIHIYPAEERGILIEALQAAYAAGKAAGLREAAKDCRIRDLWLYDGVETSYARSCSEELKELAALFEKQADAGGAS